MALRELEEDAVETVILVVAAGIVLYFGGKFIGEQIKKALSWAGDKVSEAVTAAGEAATSASEAAQQPGSGGGAVYSPDDPYVY